MHSWATSHKIKAKLYRTKAIICNCHVSLWRPDGLPFLGSYFFYLYPTKAYLSSEGILLTYYLMLATYFSTRNTGQRFGLLYQLLAETDPLLLTATAMSKTCAQKPTFSQPLMRKDSTITWLHTTLQKFVDYDQSVHK